MGLVSDKRHAGSRHPSCWHVVHAHREGARATPLLEMQEAGRNRPRGPHRGGQGVTVSWGSTMAGLHEEVLGGGTGPEAAGRPSEMEILDP